MTCHGIAWIMGFTRHQKQSQRRGSLLPLPIGLAPSQPPAGIPQILDSFPKQTLRLINSLVRSFSYLSRLGHRGGAGAYEPIPSNVGSHPNHRWALTPVHPQTHRDARRGTRLRLLSLDRRSGGTLGAWEKQGSGLIIISHPTLPFFITAPK